MGYAVSLTTLAVIACLVVVQAAPRNVENVTVTVPEGSRYLNGTHTFCAPSSARNVLVFLLGNYFAHAATIKSVPGETTHDGLVGIFVALFCPTAGIVRALESISRFNWRPKSELQQALQAGALCTVVRNKSWTPHDGDRPRDMLYRGFKEGNGGKCHKP